MVQLNDSPTLKLYIGDISFSFKYSSVASYYSSSSKS